MPNKIQTIMRTAAIIYAEDQSIQSVKSVRRRFIDAVLVNTDNSPLTTESIITSLQKDYELVVQEKDIEDILNNNRYYEIILAENKYANTYYLPNKRYAKLKEKAEYCIDDVINEFTSQTSNIDSNKLKELLYKYLYTLMNTNISAYTQLLERKGNKVSPVVDRNSFDDDEIEIINSFIIWDNPNKNKALFVLVNYSIEYATAFNSIDPQDVVFALKNKKLYLDNALIYRALGINGDYRKERVLNLIQRCVNSGQQLLISSVTRKEFFQTIDYHIGHLRSSTPYGAINPSLFNKYTGGYTLYQYYHEWRRTNSKLNTYGYELFRLHIQSEYEALLNKYNIKEDYNQQYNDYDDADKIEQYASEIKLYKIQKNDNLHINDAKNMVWVELARNKCDNNVKDTKYYFVTSDRRLQEWDLHHSKNQPITMLPSQWLALLLKYFSQSNDDYKSFVSFLTMPNEKTDVSPDELQDILAGISEITEDFQKQNDIVSELLESDSSRNNRNHVEAQKFAQNKLEASLKKELKSVEFEAQKKIDAQEAAANAMLSKQKEEFENMLDIIRKERCQEKLERLKEKLVVCKNRLKDKKTISSHIDSTADRKKNLTIIGMIVVGLVYIFVIVFFTILKGWDFMEPITYICTISLGLLLLGYSYIANKKLDFWNIPSHIRDNCYHDLCKKFDFNKPEIADLQETIDSLSSQIAEMEK